MVRGIGFIIVNLFLTLSTVGCMQQGSTAASDGVQSSTGLRHPYYFIGMYNNSSQSIRNVGWRYKINESNEFYDRQSLNPGITASYGPGLNPIPASVTMTWQTDDGAQHTQELPVAEHVADLKRFKGTIWLEYSGNAWVTRPLTDAESHERAAAGVTWPFLDLSKRGVIGN